MMVYRVLIIIVFIKEEMIQFCYNKIIVRIFKGGYGIWGKMGVYNVLTCNCTVVVVSNQPVGRLQASLVTRPKQH